jgi:hypothetical protein
MTSPASVRCVANLWRQAGKQIDVTHERDSLGSSTYLQKCRMYAPPVVLQANNEDVHRARVVVRGRASGMYTAKASTHYSPEYLPQ